MRKPRASKTARTDMEDEPRNVVSVMNFGAGRMPDNYVRGDEDADAVQRRRELRSQVDILRWA